MSRMTHEEKDALIVQLRERIAELADLLVESGERIKKQSERIAELELRLGCCRDASTGKDLLIVELEKRIVELEARLENAELEKATAEEALRRFRAECAMLKIVPTTVRTEWYGRMW